MTTLLFLLLLFSNQCDSWSPSHSDVSSLKATSRRDVASLAAATVLATTLPNVAGASVVDEYPISTTTTTTTMTNSAGFRYSDSWTGTQLPLLSLQQAAQLDTWSFARWPDPILRRPASEVATWWNNGTPRVLRFRAADLLVATATSHGAVGLAAEQCGVDARLVYVQGLGVLVNPRIVRRSPERQLKVWKEECLVLPPTFRATVLRDDWIDIQYWTVDMDMDTKSQPVTKRLFGEASRCCQHELDHDRGILILDHVELSELENDRMREIERPGHYQRMALAYDRQIEKKQ